MAAIGTLLLILRVPLEIAAQAIHNLLPLDLRHELGSRCFPLHLWHQSVSCLYPPWSRQLLLDALGTVIADSFTFQLDRLQSSSGNSGRIHWSLASCLGAPAGFNDLIEARSSAFEACGIKDRFRNTAHVTTGYDAPRRISAKRFQPVPWQPTAIELVEVMGQGDDYRYETIAARPLGPSRENPPLQSRLPF